MREYLEKVNSTVYPENEKGQLKQNSRNEIRATLISQLKDVLENAGATVSINEDGIGLALPNETLGVIPVVVGVTIKDLAYDLEDAHEEYLEKEEEKLEKARKAEELKAQKLAEKELLKSQKAKKATK